MLQLEVNFLNYYFMFLNYIFVYFNKNLLKLSLCIETIHEKDKNDM